MDQHRVVIAGRHRPHEILLLVVSLVIGIAYTFGAPAATSLAASLEPWALHVWAAGMALSAVIGLAGVLWSLRLEAAGMLIGAGALVWYIGAVAPFGWRALFAALISLAWACANIWRAMQIYRDVRGPR